MIIRLLSVFILSATSAGAEVPRVATDILPVHSLVSQVMKGVGAPDLILPPGASPHGYSMRPSEAAVLENADVVFWIGPDLTRWLADPIEVLAAGGTHVALLEQPGVILRETGDEGHDEHDGDIDHDEDDDHGDDDVHDHGEHDPHAWLDPENARIWLHVIARELAKADPENAETYWANAETADAEIASLLPIWKKMLSQLSAVNFAVLHDALGYFEDRFGIRSRFAVLSSDAEKPSPKRIAELRQHAQDEGISLIFADVTSNAALIETVFDGQSATFCRIDLLGSEIEPGPNLYRYLIDQLVNNLTECAGP